MQTKFMEVILNEKRYVGYSKDNSPFPDYFFQTSLERLCSEIEHNPGADSAVDFLNSSLDKVEFSSNEKDLLTVIPPFSPDDDSEVTVSGFMQTHNIKMDTKLDSAGNAIMPNWFSKGNSSSLKLTGEVLRAPKNMMALCEEAEIVLIYKNNAEGHSKYCGYTFGNDLTDIGRFKYNNGHLGYAKLCDAGVSCWFFMGPPPDVVTGNTVIEREGEKVWSGEFTTGLNAIGYEVSGMINNLFSYPALRNPGQVNYIYIGADRSSFHAGFSIIDTDCITLNFASHGVSLSHEVNLI